MMKFPLMVASVAVLAVLLRARAEEKADPPAAVPLMQTLASIDGSGRIVLRMDVPDYKTKPQTVIDTILDGVKEKQAVHRQQTYRLDPKDVKVYDTRGKEVEAKTLRELLKRPTLALYGYGERLDALDVRLVKDGTLIFLYAPSKAAPTPSKPPTTAPVPGLADFLNKQGYVAVPLERIMDDRLCVKVEVRGKDLRLGLDTGAGHSYFDRYRVRHLGVEWNDEDYCEIQGLDIAGVSSGPLHLYTFDMTSTNRALRDMNQPEIDGLLGADVLRPLSAVIDHAGGTLYIRQKERKK